MSDSSGSMFSRRELLKRLTAAGVVSALGGSSIAEARSQRTTASAPEDHDLFFGDLHMHNNIGYAQGTLRRSFEIARNHLDFYALTPHAYWHDMGEYANNVEETWRNGFAITKQRWPDVVQVNREFDDPGSFVTIPAYEWHSASLGDYHILFPDLDVTEEDLVLPDSLPPLKEFVRSRGCMMIPHHPGNRKGHRGANTDHWSPDVSPLVEIYSEWGCAEHDRAPYPYIRHTEGGRWTKNTLQYWLEQGHRIGVLASSDDHLGYPGAYHQGLAAVWAEDLTRESIFDALWNRRTYGVTGDRIGLNLTLNGNMMGQELEYVRERELSVDVTGWDQVDRVEVLKNNRVIHRDFPMDRQPTRESWGEPVLVRFEYGWGPWPVLGIGGTADWDIRLSIDSGSIDAVHPCFTSGPLEEDRRDRIVSHTEREVRVQSHTALKQQFESHSQKAVVLRIQGGPETQLSVHTAEPNSESQLSLSLSQLAESNEMLFTDPFPMESAMLHRVVFADRHRTSFTVSDTGDGETSDFYYARVFQANRQLAWSSPIWVDAA
jgi:hypothetical protein